MDGNSLGKFAWYLKYQHCQTARRTHKVCQAVLPYGLNKSMIPRSRHQLWSSMVVLDFAQLAMGLAQHESHYKDDLLESCFLKSPTILRLAEETHRSPHGDDAKLMPLRHRIKHTKLLSDHQRHMIR